MSSEDKYSTVSSICLNEIKKRDEEEKKKKKKKKKTTIETKNIYVYIYIDILLCITYV